MSNIIEIVRGDSLDFNYQIKRNGEPYKMLGQDKLYFGVMDYDSHFEQSIIQKIYSAEACDNDGNIVIHIEPEDTQMLLPGRYYYMIKLQLDHMTSGQNITGVETVRNKKNFIIYD